MVKTPTLVYFNNIIKSHETGKKAANASASVINGKGNTAASSNELHPFLLLVHLEKPGPV